MKKWRITGFCFLIVLLTVLCSMALADIDIQEWFPDENFRKYLRENIDKDQDGILNETEVVELNNLQYKTLGGLFWWLDENGVLTISGKGDMEPIEGVWPGDAWQRYRQKSSWEDDSKWEWNHLDRYLIKKVIIKAPS